MSRNNNTLVIDLDKRGHNLTEFLIHKTGKELKPGEIYDVGYYDFAHIVKASQIPNLIELREMYDFIFLDIHLTSITQDPSLRESMQQSDTILIPYSASRISKTQSEIPHTKAVIREYHLAVECENEVYAIPVMGRLKEESPSPFLLKDVFSRIEGAREMEVKDKKALTIYNEEWQKYFPIPAPRKVDMEEIKKFQSDSGRRIRKFLDDRGIKEGIITICSTEGSVGKSTLCFMAGIATNKN